MVLKYSMKRLLSSPVLLFFIISMQLTSVKGYNLSPKPNIAIKDPQLTTYMPKYQSSYFGYTINLRPMGVIIGAPRAQSTLESQRHINETGAIYRCSLTNTTCYPYIFENNGNLIKEPNTYTYDSESRDNQWLGASMDGGIHDTDKLIVCAPRLTTPLPNDMLMHGICYWINDTLSMRPMNVKKISPLQGRKEQMDESSDKVRYYYYMLAEQGLSVHVTPDDKEFLIGAPGIHTWKGSVIRYYQGSYLSDPNLSRRDVEGRRVPRQLSPEPKSEVIEYKSQVPNPKNWGQKDDSYFGYAVASGYFDKDNPEHLSYIATAPQADDQSGEAYLFDMSDSPSDSANSIKLLHVFRGTKFGEYFGYSVLAEDLNNDGLTDVIISAPQHSISGFSDDGAIYVFMNKGKFTFERKLYASPVHGRARFGTTLSQLGDINHDGYKDIAVGAPYADGNGAAFIYLGGEKGLRDKPSQHLRSPKGIISKFGGAHMYGHGLSKGADIDSNGFNDLAIGAPNAEGVFVYRAYPVIKVHTSISSQPREIKPEQPRFKATVCYGMSTSSDSVQNQPMILRVVMDPQVKRVKILSVRNNEITFNVTAERQQRCQVLECEVRYSLADIFKPIELEVHHEIINRVPDSNVFCDYCVAIDPDEPKVFSEKIIFSTGCATDICEADLSVKSLGLEKSYTLGSSRTITVTYEINNSGESAYLPQINVTSANRLPFALVPSNCKIESNVFLVCDLNRGQALAKGARDFIKITYDVSGVSGKTMVLRAEVFSTGRERNPMDNIAKDVIALKEFTHVEVTGSPKTPHINLEKVKDTAQIINNYEIKSNGPSMISVFEVKFTIPISYKLPGLKTTIPIVDLNNITMQAVYDSQLININYYQNATQLLLNAFEVTTTTSTTGAQVTRTFSHSMNGMNYDAVRSGHVNELSTTDVQNMDNSVIVASLSSRHRRRREIAAENTASKEQYARLTHARAHDLLDDDMKDQLPVNRTIVFNCNDPEAVECVSAVMRIYNFQTDKPITVTMKYTVDLNEINQILIEPWEFFVILIGVDVHKIGDDEPQRPANDPQSLLVSRKIEYNIVSKHQLYSIPIWIIILAIIGGLLLLALMTYGMYKAGFFKRAKKEEMDKLVNQNHGEPEAENLTTEEH